MTPDDIAKLRIIHYPDPHLRKTCEPVEQFDGSITRLAERMLHLMHESRGIGLAAPQVGVLLRMFVCNVTGEPDDDHVYVNPKLSGFEGIEVGEEGCLSIPDATVNVRRPTGCEIRAADLSGHAVKCMADGLLARCWQHECDHLDGRIILDYMSEADKLANRRAIKQLEADFKPRRAASK